MYKRQKQPTVAASPSADNHSNWYDALLRIPSDAKALLNGFAAAQQERIGRGTLGGFLDWLTMGAVSGLYEGLKTRTDAMTKDPSLYHIVNWLTLGNADMVKGAFSPDEPLSLEHWLNSLGVASIAVGAYELAQKYAPAMIDDVAAFELSLIHILMVAASACWPVASEFIWNRPHGLLFIVTMCRPA